MSRSSNAICCRCLLEKIIIKNKLVAETTSNLLPPSQTTLSLLPETALILSYTLVGEGMREKYFIQRQCLQGKLSFTGTSTQIIQHYLIFAIQNWINLLQPNEVQSVNELFVSLGGSPQSSFLSSLLPVAELLIKDVKH